MNVKRLTEEQEKEIVSLYNTGTSIGRLYSVHGYSCSVVYKVLAKYGLKELGTRKKYKPPKKPVMREVIHEKAIDCDQQGERCIFYNHDKAANFKCNYCIVMHRARGGDPRNCVKYKFDKKGQVTGNEG